MDVIFTNGGKRVKGEIIVDSGAAECVMPRDLLPNVEMMQPKEGVRFAAATGGAMGNFGRKMLEFIPSSDSDFRRQV